MSIRRFSSRTHRLDASFLMQHLAGARSYKRIAGYFTSSLFSAINLGISKLYNTGTGWPALQLKIQPEIGIANNKKYNT